MDKDLVELVENIVEKKIKKMKIPNTRVAKIVSINIDGTVDVIMPPSDKAIHKLQNKSGETLSVNDSVFLLLVDGTMSNTVVWLKRGV